MHYSLWLLKSPRYDYPHIRCFEEVAQVLQSAFRELGHEASIIRELSQAKGQVIAIGGRILHEITDPLPADMIIFNFEQVHEKGQWFAPDHPYLGFLKRFAVWDYSHNNIAALKALGVKDVTYCGIGYMPLLTRIEPAAEDIDVLFIGTPHPRRQQVLDALTQRGLRTHVVHGQYGKERDAFIARSKLVLNIHMQPANVFEVVRVSYLLANRKCVISEPGDDKILEGPYEKAVVFTPYEQLAERCAEYVKDEKKRRAQAERGFSQFSAMPQAPMLKQALALLPLPRQRGRVGEGVSPTFGTGGQAPSLTLPPLGRGNIARIFVNIASYCDPECGATVADMFAKATHPERVFAGICLQLDPQGNPACDVHPDRPEQVRIHRVDHQVSQGANWARNEAQQLWQDEEYILQIDSHMRFAPGWDETLLAMHSRCPSPKAILSTYAPLYTPPDTLSETPGKLLRICVQKFAENAMPQLLHLTKLTVPLSDERAGLYPSPFYIANFMFCPSELLQALPFDPHVHFWGDEISYTARLWTHGWDVYQPDQPVLYHYWRRDDLIPSQGYRPIKARRNQRTLARVKHLLGFEISHDTLALTDIERFGLGSERTLETLWEFIGVNWQERRISKVAKEGRWNMAAKKALVKKTKHDGPPRIFVQIATYRDQDCQWTVKDMFEKAANPDRIFVGICWQFIKGEDDECFQIPYPRPEQVRVIDVDAKKSKGVCWARSQIESLWQGEEYTLIIDSHMRFEPGWDDLLLSMWKDCDSDHAVLSCYPPGFIPPDDRDRRWIFGMSANEFDRYGIFLMKGAPPFEIGVNEPEKPIPGAFSAAGLVFGPSSIITDVPYDPYLYFFGEEITRTVRLWTSGYDLYHPNALVIFHDWERDKRKKTHFSDHINWDDDNQRSFARVRHMLGTEKTDNKEALKELDKYGLGKVRTLEAYQHYSGVNFAEKTIAEHALKGRFQPYKKLASDTGGKVRIFVNIASYRDPECQWTVKDLFEKATYPDRIHVGICWQFDPEEDKHCFEVSTRPEQVRMLPVDWREAEGVCWARYQTQLLWDGEEYTLMIDSHMRFVPGWDELMIAELAACPSEKPVLSCSPVPYTPPNDLGRNMHPTIRRVKPFQSDGNIRCQGEALDRSPEIPLKGAFLVANFVFSRSDIIKDVPYDPYLYFDQEEITYAARLYTHGWDVFSARKQFLYHYYNTAQSVRPLHWKDLHKEDSPRIRFLRDRGLNRFNHMTGYRLSQDPEVLRELDIYGFGKVRTLQAFEEFTGVDFKRKTTSEKALRALFIKDLATYRDRPIHVPEIDNQKKPAAPDIIAGNPAAPEKILERGDFVPLFEMRDTQARNCAIETFAGKPSLLVFLPAKNPDYIDRFMRSLHHEISKAGLKDFWQVFAADDSTDNLNALRKKLNIGHSFIVDSERKLARAFGLCRPEDTTFPPTGYVLNANLKIASRHTASDPAQLAAALVASCKSVMDAARDKNQQQRVISELPPVLIVPDAFTPEFCARCIESFKTGHTFDGTVGAESKKAYQPNAKVRTDHIVGGKLLAEIDDKLSRSLFPEIKKVFGFEVTRREMYKVGLYTGEKKGFFRQHRDNFDTPLGYRRIAMTLHLSDDYDGGGLRFPEYDDHIYRPAMGSAIAFSCATMHEARPVTRGERFVLVGFFHGDEDEAYRHHYLMGKNMPAKDHEYTPALRQYPTISQSRAFVQNWRAENVHFGKSDGTAMQTRTAQLPNGQDGIMSQKPNIMINTLGDHKAKKTFESSSAIIFDDFLPEDLYKKVNDFALTTDYEYINTGKVTRAWHVHDGFPLRSSLNVFYHGDEANKPQGDYVYPTKTALDHFVEHILSVQPQVEQMVGKKNEAWDQFSTTAWIYPHGTGLSMHDDGAGVYSGAFVYFLNPTWKPHWGGLLLMVDEQGNQKIYDHAKTQDPMDYYKRNWLHANASDELLMEHGYAQCIMPKKNRIVFIANNAFHMVTRVNEQAGDNLRMSLAGFFNKKKA